MNDFHSLVWKSLRFSQLKSIMFLVENDIDFNNYQNLCNSEDELRKYLSHKFKQKRLIFFLELLGTLKQYKLLKNIGFCKHEYFRNECDLHFIKPYWKLLYKICDNLREDELNKLKDYFRLSNMEINCSEDLFYYLHTTNSISENDFSHLLEALKKIHRLDLVKIIENYIETKPFHKDKYYIRTPTKSDYCGLAIIINICKFEFDDSNASTLQERNGSTKDKEKLVNLWEKFGFKVEAYENLSGQQISSLFLELKNRNTVDFDVFVACLMSHGEEGVIFGSDGTKVQLKFILDCASKCSFLNEKPKVFFIQACQGKKHQISAFNNGFSFESDSIADYSNVNQYSYIDGSDICQAIATVPGYVSYRDETGSIFIAKLAEELTLNGDKEDLEQLMKKVKKSLSDGPCKQMPILKSTLTKVLVFKRVIE